MKKLLGVMIAGILLSLCGCTGEKKDQIAVTEVPDVSVETSGAENAAPSELREGEYLTYRFVDENGNPLSHISGALTATLNGGIYHTALLSKEENYEEPYSDENGELVYALRADDRLLGAEEVSLVLTAFYDNTLTQTVSEKLPSSPQTIVVTWTQAAPPTEKPAQTTGLRIKVVDESGNPVQGVKLSGSPFPKEHEGPVVQIARLLEASDADGIIRWDDITEAGTYVMADENRSYELIYPGDGSLAEQTILY